MESQAKARRWPPPLTGNLKPSSFGSYDSLRLTALLGLTSREYFKMRAKVMKLCAQHLDEDFTVKTEAGRAEALALVDRSLQAENDLVSHVLITKSWRDMFWLGFIGQVGNRDREPTDEEKRSEAQINPTAQTIHNNFTMLLKGSQPNSLALSRDPSSMVQHTTSVEPMMRWADCTIKWAWIDMTGDKIMAASINARRCVDRKILARMGSYDRLDPLFLSFPDFLRVCMEEAHARGVVHNLSDFQFVSLYSRNDDGAQYRLLRTSSDIQEAYKDHMKNSSDVMKWRVFTVWPGTVPLHDFDFSDDDRPPDLLTVKRAVHSPLHAWKPWTFKDESGEEDYDEDGVGDDDNDEDGDLSVLNRFQTESTNHHGSLESEVASKRKREPNEQYSADRPHISHKKPHKSSKDRSTRKSKTAKTQTAFGVLSSKHN